MKWSEHLRGRVENLPQYIIVGQVFKLDENENYVEELDRAWFLYTSPINPEHFRFHKGYVPPEVR